MNFSAAILDENANGRVSVIPDIKCISPKHGDLLRRRDPVKVAKALVHYGAPVLSVVTESKKFGGSIDLLRAVSQTTCVPVLRKDFFVHEAQLEESCAAGAAAVLLICATTKPSLLEKLYERAIALGLEPLVEVCTEDEMRFAARLGATLVGINNKNIATYELDEGCVSRTAKLARLAPEHAVLISESGICCAEDAKRAAEAGANAVLVGTALWQADDMQEKYESLRVRLCGQA